jgi:hypothetical protein
MSSASTTLGALPSPSQPTTATTATTRSPWISGPWFDLLCIANIFWPLMMLLIYGFGQIQQAEWFKQINEEYGLNLVVKFETTLDFWLVYLLITPHRWVTLALVFGDAQKFQERSRMFMWIALLAALFVLINAVTTEELVLVLLVDYVWNAWHFGAQHSGVSRIYARIAHPGDQRWALLEKILLRTFFVYVILRAGIPLMNQNSRAVWLGWFDNLTPYFYYSDWPMLALPLTVLMTEVVRFHQLAWGRMIYLVSVCSLYSGIMLCSHYNQIPNQGQPITAGLLLAVTIFHSTEYLGIVSWSVRKTYARREQGFLPFVAKHWSLSLPLFMLGLGTGAYFLHHHDEQMQRAWFGLNAIVSFMHYAYDGMIWKSRPSKSAG